MVISSSFKSSSFPDDLSAIRVLKLWRVSGVELALQQLYSEYRSGFDGLLLAELHRRLLGESAPSLFIDGIWFCKSSFGGISRVWNQIFNTFSLPGMCTYRAPITVINRGNLFLSNRSIFQLQAPFYDPHDFTIYSRLALSNCHFIKKFSADIFCSSWISTSGVSSPSCIEIALVHDCIPEHFNSTDPLLMPLRHRWISSSSSTLSVSAHTAIDLQYFYKLSTHLTPWCHLSTYNDFVPDELSFSSFANIISNVGINQPFIVLPGSGLVGTYKNPNIVAQALLHPSLRNLHLLITGINSGAIRDSILSTFPHLSSRIFIAGFTDYELLIIYKYALCVVVPSLIEGFGLPVIESMSVGGIPIIADVSGLREAGAEASLRFNPTEPHSLIQLLQFLLDSQSRLWISSRLASRVSKRLKRLNPDLFGLALLAKARTTFDNSL